MHAGKHFTNWAISLAPVFTLLEYVILSIAILLYYHSYLIPEHSCHSSKTYYSLFLLAVTLHSLSSATASC